jgi:hypothetical protein
LPLWYLQTLLKEVPLALTIFSLSDVIVVMHDRMVDGFTITTKFVGFNPAHGEVYSIQHYVIKCVSDRHHITETLFQS